jgi:hypothetical protein
MSNSDSEQRINAKVCVKFGRSVHKMYEMLSEAYGTEPRNQVLSSRISGSKVVEVTWKMLEGAVIWK